MTYFKKLAILLVPLFLLGANCCSKECVNANRAVRIKAEYNKCVAKKNLNCTHTDTAFCDKNSERYCAAFTGYTEDPWE